MVAQKRKGLDGSHTVELSGDERLDAGEKKVDPRRQTWNRTPSAEDIRREQPTVFQSPPEELIALTAKDFSQVRVNDDSPASSASFRMTPITQLLPPLPKDAPDWMRAARALSAWLELLIERKNIDEWERVGIERATVAWKLTGISRRRMRGVANLMRRAHAAIRNPELGAADTAVHDCAEVVYQSLPRDLRARTSMETVAEVVRDLRDEADAWIGVVHATSKLLGWTEYARAHAARALRCAIEAGESTESQTG